MGRRRVGRGREEKGRGRGRRGEWGEEELKSAEWGKGCRGREDNGE